jgi:hypothetical protein
MPHLDLTDAEAAALTQELHSIVENDRYPFSPQIRTQREILAKLRPEPVRERLPLRKVHGPQFASRLQSLLWNLSCGIFPSPSTPRSMTLSGAAAGVPVRRGAGELAARRS